jgi:hypothetical protein
MRRHAARSLLLVMLMGILAPSALAVLAAPPHACCLRKKSHCHSSRPAGELTFHAANCGQHDCCRALPATRYAKLQPSLSTKITHHCQTIHTNLNFAYSHAYFNTSRSVRAPPSSSIS